MTELSIMSPICCPQAWRSAGYAVSGARYSDLWAFEGFLQWSPGALEFTQAMCAHCGPFSLLTKFYIKCTKLFIFLF